jgi:hypothetical protein
MRATSAGREPPEYRAAADRAPGRGPGDGRSDFLGGAQGGVATKWRTRRVAFSRKSA